MGMDLHTYMRSHGLTDTEMAEKTGFSSSAIGKWRRLERFPRPKQMQRIRAATEGAVCPADFYEVQSHSSAPGPSPQVPRGAEAADPPGEGQPGGAAAREAVQPAGEGAGHNQQGVG